MGSNAVAGRSRSGCDGVEVSGRRMDGNGNALRTIRDLVSRSHLAQFYSCMAHRFASRVVERAVDAAVTGFSARLACPACPAVSCATLPQCPACPNCPLSSFSCPDCRPSCECHPALVSCEPSLILFFVIGFTCFLLGVAVGSPLLHVGRCALRRVSTPTRRAQRDEEESIPGPRSELQQEARAQVALLRASRSSQ